MEIEILESRRIRDRLFVIHDESSSFCCACSLTIDRGGRGEEGERERQARKFATTSCHGQPASFASRSYHSVHDPPL